MQSDKLNKNAPAHPTNAPQPATAIPHDEVSLKQSDVHKQSSAPTQVKQGNTVTLTQVEYPLSSGMPAFGHDHWSHSSNVHSGPLCVAKVQSYARVAVQHRPSHGQGVRAATQNPLMLLCTADFDHTHIPGDQKLCHFRDTSLHQGWISTEIVCMVPKNSVTRLCERVKEYVFIARLDLNGVRVSGTQQ